MANEKGGGGIANSPVISVWTSVLGEAVIGKVDFLPGYPDSVGEVSKQDLPSGGVDTSQISDPDSPPDIEDINTSGIPDDYQGKIQHTTSWPTIDVELEESPDLSFLADEKETAVDPSTEYTGEVTIPEVSATEFSDTYTPKGHAKIPVPPSITIEVNTNEIPEFTVNIPEKLIDWAYEQYASELLEILKNESDELLTTPIKLDTSSAILRDHIIWDSPSYFLKARGIQGLTARETVESNRFRDNINRLIAILEASYAEQNKHTYVETRQALENLERGIYDAKKQGEFAFAKAWAENRINAYVAKIESYNQLLNAYRMQSLAFQEEIEREKVKLADYKAKVEEYRKAGQIDEALLRDYLAQINIVNSTIKAYKLSMSVSEAIANINLMSAEMDRLNTESFVLRARALANAADADTYYEETELMKLDLIEKDIEYAKVSLEKSAAQLERTIGMLQEEIDEQEFGTEKSLANIRAQIEKARAQYWADIVRKELLVSETRAKEEKAEALRRADRTELAGQKIKDRLDARVDAVNDRVWKELDGTYIDTGLVTSYRMQALERVNEAEAIASNTLRKAQLTQSLTQTIIEGSSS